MKKTVIDRKCLNITYRDTKNLKILIHKLLSVRNKILNILNKTKELKYGNDLIQNEKKNDFLSKLTLANRFRNTKFTNPFFLWKIKKKDKSAVGYEGSEMTDDEKE